MKSKNQLIKESNRLQILETKIRKMVREEILREEQTIGRIPGYDVGLFEDGSLVIGNNSDDIIVRITNKKMAQKFVGYIESAITKMK